MREILSFEHNYKDPDFLSTHGSLFLPHIAIWSAVFMSLIALHVLTGHHIQSTIHLFPVFSTAYVCVMCIQIVFIHTHGHTMKSNPHCCNPVKCYLYFCIESGNSMVLQALSFSKLVQWLNLLRRPPSSNSGCRHLCSFIFHVYYIKVHYSLYLCDIYW